MISYLIFLVLFPFLYRKLARFIGFPLLSPHARLLFYSLALLLLFPLYHYQHGQPNLFQLTGVTRSTPQQRFKTKNWGILGTNLGRWAYDQFDEQNIQQLGKYMYEQSLQNVVLQDCYSNFFQIVLLFVRDRHHMLLKLNCIFVLTLVQTLFTLTAQSRLNSPVDFLGSVRIKEVKNMIQTVFIYVAMMISFYREFIQISGEQRTLLTIKRTIESFELESKKAQGRREELLLAILDLKQKGKELMSQANVANVAVRQQIGDW